ncbi:uncharacterized protein DS421_16g559940 [Arachis hypogaea]|nr:uncharacterized protein DS421_16g559940 [Arachis hypogaea]
MRRRGGRGSLSSKLLSSPCRAATTVIIAGCCCCAGDKRRLWVRHHRAEPLRRTIVVANLHAPSPLRSSAVVDEPSRHRSGLKERRCERKRRRGATAAAAESPELLN